MGYEEGKAYEILPLAPRGRMVVFERPSTQVQQIQVQKNKKIITWEAMQSLKKRNNKNKIVQYRKDAR